MRYQAALAGFACTLSAQASAQQERMQIVERRNTTPPCDGGTTTYLLDQSGSATFVNINFLSSCASRINVTHFDFISTTDTLNIDGGSALAPFEVVLGPDVFIDPDASPIGIFGDWRGATIFTLAPESVFFGECSGDLIGSLTGFDKIARFDCGGAISALVQATEGVDGRGVVMDVGTVSSSGSIDVGKLESLDVAGSCAGNIFADELTTSIAIGGSQTDGAIEGIDLDGTITAGGALRRVRISNSSGALRGDVTAHTLGVVDAQSLPPINIPVLHASVFIEEDVLLPAVIVEDWSGSDEVFGIGRTLEDRNNPIQGNRIILLFDPDDTDGQVTNGLSNQIIINAGDNTPTTDISEFWLGAVSIDYPGNEDITDPGDPAKNEVLIGPGQPQPYQAPYYTAVSSELGGGAIGLAPFNFHQRESAPPAGESRDCDPYQNEQLVVGPLDDLSTVRIRHYGPVYADGGGPHFRVEFRPRWFPSVWQDKTSLFEVDTTQTGTSDATATRDAHLKATSQNQSGFKVPGSWRIRPLAGKVRCADVDGNPDALWDSGVVSGDLGSSTGTQHSWYAFGVKTYLAMGSASSPVFEGDQVNASDIAAWPVEPFETNADGRTDAGDLADMVDAYDP